MSLAERIGLQTESPFTQTPAKRILSALGLGLEGERRRIRNEKSLMKRAEWEAKSFRIRVGALANMRLHEAEKLIHQDHEGYDRATKPHLEAALKSSDANQAEIDFLTGKSKIDPRPTHKINYDAGNNPEREDVIIDFSITPPFLSRETETIGDAQYRNRTEGGRDITYTGSGGVMKEKVRRKRTLKIGDKHIPLPPKRETRYFARYRGH